YRYWYPAEMPPEKKATLRRPLFTGCVGDHSSALAVATIETGHAAIHVNNGLGTALAAQARTGGKGAVFFAVRRFRLFSGNLLLFLFDERFLVRVQIVLQQADGLHVGFNRFTDFRHQRRHELASLLEVTTLGIEYRFHLFHQEGAV